MSALLETAQTRDAFIAKRIVVTGGAGFLGRVVVRKLRECGCRTIVAPRRAQCDLARADAVARLLDEAKPDLIVHLAASVDNPAGCGNAAQSFCNNVLMTTQLMDAACRRGIEKMLCLGSASSYPEDAPIPRREDDLFRGLPEPGRAAHGIAKRIPLIQAQACRQQYGFQCIFLIPTNFYGPGDNFDCETSYVIPSLIRKFTEAVERHSKEVVLHGTGGATRDFLHVEDCAEGILLALQKYSGAAPVNLGSGNEVSIHELARTIAGLAGYTERIIWDSTHSDGAARRVLDISRSEREFGFRPRIDLQEGLRETMEWYRASRSNTVREVERQQLVSRV